MDLLLAAPRGFCAGVVRAVDIVDRALEMYGAPVYVKHEIVHNRQVVERLKAKGAVFVEDLAEVPAGARPAGDRRDLPAGHESPPRGGPLRPPGVLRRLYRPPQPPGTGRHAGRDR